MTVLLVDTYSVFFRAFYALPAMTTRAGEPTSALYGFSVLLLKLLREVPGAALAFAVDTPEQTFRERAYEDYKAGRAVTPAPLRSQFERLPVLLEAFGAPVIGSPGFEADDVLATLARIARERGEESLVVSGDRDLLQLAHGCVKVHFIGRRGEPATAYDEARVVERFGVSPAELPTYVALVGDASDNLPSVPGIGPKTARKLVQAHSNARELVARIDEVKPERVREALRAHAEQIVATEELARLREDAPIECAALPGDEANAEAHWRVPTPEAFERLRSVFEELEFRSLLARVEKLMTPRAER